MPSARSRNGLGRHPCPLPVPKWPTWPGCRDLALTDEELDHFAVQLDQIISAVARVQEVAAEGIPPTSHAVPVTNVFRDDVVVPPLGAGKVLDQAPAVEQQRFRVPATSWRRTDPWRTRSGQAEPCPPPTPAS